jgi:hypothetical protein
LSPSFGITDELRGTWEGPLHIAYKIITDEYRFKLRFPEKIVALYGYEMRAARRGAGEKDDGFW